MFTIVDEPCMAHMWLFACIQGLIIINAIASSYSENLHVICIMGGLILMTMGSTASYNWGAQLHLGVSLFPDLYMHSSLQIL